MQEDAEKEEKMEGGLLGDATAAASFDTTAAAGAGAERYLGTSRPLRMLHTHMLLNTPVCEGRAEVRHGTKYESSMSKVCTCGKHCPQSFR